MYLIIGEFSHCKSVRGETSYCTTSALTLCLLFYSLLFLRLSSTIPSEYGNMISLTSLSLQSNYKDEKGYFTWGINGKLPSELGRLKNLQHLHMNDNYLTGTLISEIGQLFLLETLHLQNNFLQGPIPDTYSNCVLLKEVLLEDNSIDSQFGMPEGICRLPELDLAKVDCSLSCSCCHGC